MIAEILVLCPFGADFGLISKAAELTPNTHIRVLLPENQAATASQFGAGYIHTLPDGYSAPDERLFSLWLADKITAWGCRILLAPATVQLRGIMPLLAWQLGAGLTADCTHLSLAGAHLRQTRPAFGNSLIAEIDTHSPIQMATIHPGTFPLRRQPVSNPVIIPELPPQTGNRIRLLEQIPFPVGSHLHQAQIIIAGGLGVGSREGFAKLEQLAKKLGAAVAASRGAVDAGFVPYRCQVGMTGITVRPKIYIAVGISGAVQHLAGMTGSETVIAINTDPKAPIFDYADYGIVADWESVYAQLEELL